MMGTNRTWALLCAALVFGPTLAIEVAMGARQTPDGSQGWHIPESAAMERNPEPVSDAVLVRGQSLYKRTAPDMVPRPIPIISLVT
jgi:hypothetical protein